MFDLIGILAQLFCAGFTLIWSLLSVLKLVREKIRARQLRASSDQYRFHTAGPWTIEKAGAQGELFDFCIMSPDGDILADVYARSLPDKHLPSFVNARLIAAAPEMFRLLEDAHAALRHHPDGDTRDIPEVAATSALLRRVQYGP